MSYPVPFLTPFLEFKQLPQNDSALPQVSPTTADLLK